MSDVGEFDDGSGPFMEQAHVPELSTLDDAGVVVEPAGRWPRDALESVAAVDSGRRFIHLDDGEFVATTFDPANCLAVQTTLPADADTSFWTSTAGPSTYDTLVDNIDEWWPPLVFHTDDLEATYRAAADKYDLSLWVSEYDEWPVAEVEVSDRDQYATAVVPGWRLAGALTMAVRQAQAKGSFTVDVYSDGETLSAAADLEGVEDGDSPEETVIAAGEFPEFRSHYSTDYLETIATTISGDDHLVRVDDEVPLLLDDGTTRYALAPRLTIDDEDGGSA